MDTDKRIKELEAQVRALTEAIRVLAVQGGQQVANGVDVSQLTFKQACVVAMLCEGMTYREIAEKVGLSESTVKIMMRMSFHKLGVRNQQEFNLAIRDRVKVMVEMGVLKRMMGVPEDFGKVPDKYPGVLAILGEKKHV